MQTLGIAFRIRPVVRERLFPLSKASGFPLGGEPEAKKVTPPNPHLIKSLRVIRDIKPP